MRSTRIVIRFGDLTAMAEYPGCASPDVLDDLRIQAFRAFKEAWETTGTAEETTTPDEM